MTWFTAQSVTINTGQTIASVNNGDDVQIAQEAGGLIIGNNPPVEIKRTFRDAGGAPKIELRLPWPYTNQLNQPAVAFPTDADLAEATRVLREITSDFDMLPSASTVVLRTETGKVKTANATEANDAVALGQLGEFVVTLAGEQVVEGTKRFRDLKGGSTSSINGTTIIEDNYAGDQSLTNLGTIRSSGGTLLGNGVKQAEGSQGLVSTTSIGFVRSGLLVESGHLKFLGSSPISVEIGIDQPVPLSEFFIIDSNGKITAPFNGGSVDTTPNRLLKVGDFGIGANYTSGQLPIVPNNNLDGAEALGIYRYFDIVTGRPNFGSGFGNVLNVPTIGFSSENYGTQLAMDYAQDRIGFRRLSAAWQPWREIYHQTNILGPVSQSGGTPTGGIIERGSNASGQYTKFADGTMICTLIRGAQLGMSPYDSTGFFVGSWIWQFPAMFAAQPCVTGSGVDSVGLGWISCQGTSFTDATVNYFASSAVNTSTFHTLIAIGRWF